MVMGSEKFCLRWNDFEHNISSAFRYLRDDRDFFDVTLVCNEEQIQAHKVILAACSVFFHKILRRNPHQHPLLYMKGVKVSDMKAVLDFMYHGEVNVAQEELNSFLSVAEDLCVKGLTQDQNVKTKQPTNIVENEITVREDSRKETHNTQISRNSSESAQPIEDDLQQQVMFVKTEPRGSQATKCPSSSAKFISSSAQEQSVAMYEEDEEALFGCEEEQQFVGEGIITTNNEMPVQSGEEEFESFLKLNSAKIERSTWSCYLCGKITNKSSHMRQHFEAFHYSLGQMQCEVCQKTFKTRHSLATHVSKNHRNHENIYSN